MQTFWKRFVLFILLIDPWVTIMGSKEITETCAELKLDDATQGVNVFKVTEGSYVNISFKLTTNKCHGQPAWFRVKVSTYQKNRLFPFCTIIFHNQKCNVTDNSQGCHCLHENRQPRAWIYRKASLSDMVQILEWTDSKVSGTHKEEAFVLSVSPKPEAEKTETLLTIAITSAGAVSLLIFIAVTIACIMRHRARDEKAKNDVCKTKEEDMHHYSMLNHEGPGCEAKVMKETTYTDAASPTQSHCFTTFKDGSLESSNEYVEPAMPVTSVITGVKVLFHK